MARYRRHKIAQCTLSYPAGHLLSNVDGMSRSGLLKHTSRIQLVEYGCVLALSMTQLHMGFRTTSAHDHIKHVLRDRLQWLRVPQRVHCPVQVVSANVQGAPWSGTAVYRQSLPASYISRQGGGENAELDIARLDNAAPYRKGGHRGT